jgi:hypothetical protein
MLESFGRLLAKKSLIFLISEELISEKPPIKEVKTDFHKTKFLLYQSKAKILDHISMLDIVSIA